jgi:methionine-rich copper-binding protein CopC
VYIKAGDAYAYADSDCTIKISASDLQQLFLIGIVLSASGALSKPAGFSVTNGVAALTYIKPNAETATSADIATLYSSEYVVPVVPPAAIALSSIVPVDNANDVAIDSTIVLTFNNEIDTEGVVVTKADGTIVAGAKAWDASGKILTFTPAEDLAKETVYALAASVVNFTTVAAAG